MCSCHPDSSVRITSSCYPCRCPGWQEARGPALPHVSFMVARCQHRASYFHIRITDFISVPPPSAPGATPRCGKEIPLYSVHTIPGEAVYVKVDPGEHRPDGIANIPALSGCKFQLPPCHVHPLKTCPEELPVIRVPWVCISHTRTVRALMLLRRKGNPT